MPRFSSHAWAASHHPHHGLIKRRTNFGFIARQHYGQSAMSANVFFLAFQSGILYAAF
jgi:hypothetical protein